MLVQFVDQRKVIDEFAGDWPHAPTFSTPQAFNLSPLMVIDEKLKHPAPRSCPVQHDRTDIAALPSPRLGVPGLRSLAVEEKPLEVFGALLPVGFHP